MDHIKVLNGDLSTHPHCQFHGPALSFCKTFDNGAEPQVYFACSAVRDQSLCSVLFNKNQQVAAPMDSISCYREKLIRNERLLKQIKRLTPNKRGYCAECKCLVVAKDFEIHSNHRSFKIGLSDDVIDCPTNLLTALDNDIKEAQYFFTESTVKTLLNVFQQLNFRKIICIGAPRLHEQLKSNFKFLGIQSILLDLDDRLDQFYGQSDFYLYNMFNNYFLDGSHRQDNFQDFLKDSDAGEICLLTDPPFGCRTEPLVCTIKTISGWYRTQNSFNNILPVMWVFPYFMETYIKNEMPEMEMLSYKINYTNHKAYHDGAKGRKYGSPIRIFTNVPLSLITLPIEEGYKNCKHCHIWVGPENQHCLRCKVCPSKNGATYVHCKQCETCVKPSYKHCVVCQRCTQIEGHKCIDYQKNLRCWICRTVGHNEMNCLEWISRIGDSIIKKCRKELKSKRARKICLICGNAGHNERVCGKRDTLLKERQFGSEFRNIFLEID